MDDIAWHHDPVWSSDSFVRADLSEHGLPGRFEQFWTTKVGARSYKICCIPFFADGIALGDIVETDSEWTIKGVVEKGEYRTMRIAIVNNARVDELHDLLNEWVDGSGLLSEWYTPGYLAVAYRADSAEHRSLTRFEEFAARGDLQIELDA